VAFEWRDAGLVSLGAVAGALLRFGVSSLVPSPTFPYTTFPWATLFVNLAGALVIGMLVLPSGAEHTVRLLVVVGFLGSFTTLSTYSAETVELFRSGSTGLGVLNMIANGAGGPLMALAGWRLALAFGGAAAA